MSVSVLRSSKKCPAPASRTLRLCKFATRARCNCRLMDVSSSTYRITTCRTEQGNMAPHSAGSSACKVQTNYADRTCIKAAPARALKLPDTAEQWSFCCSGATAGIINSTAASAYLEARPRKVDAPRCVSIQLVQGHHLVIQQLQKVNLHAHQRKYPVNQQAWMEYKPLSTPYNPTCTPAAPTAAQHWQQAARKAPSGCKQASLLCLNSCT